MNIKKILLYIALIIIFLILFDKLLMPFYVGKNEVKVPNVVGMTYEQARVILEQNKLEPTLGGERYDSKYPKGTIILQRPNPNKIVKEGRRIYLIVSGGQIQVEIPNVKYKTVEEASIILSRNGLTLGQIFEDTLSDVPRGLITSQSINPGEKIEKGSAIDIWVSAAGMLGNIEVPNLINLSFKEARTIIESKNLRVGKVVYQPSIDYLPNTVIYQYPASGAYVQEQTTIDLIVVREKILGKEIIE